MNKTANRWEKNINKAVNELSGNEDRPNVGISVTLPPWTTYLLCTLFGVLLANYFISGADVHPVNEPKDYETGGKVALLMVAEDIESYRQSYGVLPEQAPNAIADVLGIEYQKVDNQHFRLSMPHFDNEIIFDDKEDKLTLAGK